MFKEQARYLIKRRLRNLWAQVSVPGNTVIQSAKFVEISSLCI
jgi:hypothetical protein